MKNLLILPRLRPTNKMNYDYTFPLGICYIASVIKKNGFHLDCINLNHLNGSVEEILEKELKKGYDNVLSGNIFVGYLVLKEIVSAVRKFSSKSKIIIGGSVISSDPSIIENLKPDFGIIGEGEMTIINLLKTGQNKPEEIKDLDELPYPDFESFGFDEYLNNLYTNQDYFTTIEDYPRIYPIIGSRGCPFNCTFCYHHGKYRERSIDSIIDELKYAIKKYKINIVVLFDDLFSINKKRLIEFCDKIKQFNIKWSCQVSIQYLDEEILKHLKESGCFVISYGFESYDENVLKSMKKPITSKQIDFAIKKSMENKINIQGNFIFGDLAETKETANRTLDYWEKNCKGQLNLAFIQPYPGSFIYNECLKKGLIKDKLTYISQICGGEIYLNMTHNMTNEEYIDLVNKIKELRNSSYYYSKINEIERIKKNYKIKVSCPFCNKVITYENFDPFKSPCLICRECFMRFYAISDIKEVNEANWKAWRENG